MCDEEQQCVRKVTGSNPSGQDCLYSSVRQPMDCFVWKHNKNISITHSIKISEDQCLVFGGCSKYRVVGVILHPGGWTLTAVSRDGSAPG